MGLVVVGVDLGQRHDPTAVAVIEATEREIAPPSDWALPRDRSVVHARDLRRAPAKTETVYVGRSISRLPLGTSYPDVARHLAGVVTALVARGVARPVLMVDVTGVGLPVVDILREALGPRKRDLIAVTFTHGTKYTQRGGSATVGKAYLVSRLQALLQTERLKLPVTPETAALARELSTYEIRVDEDANDRYGAFKVGTHDDLVTAVGLATCYQDQRGFVRIYPGLL